MILGRPDDAGARLAWGACAVLATAACAGSHAVGGDAGGRPGQGTVADEVGCVVGRTPLTLGEGVFPYIEPEDLIRVGSRFVVVGSPTYTWGPGGAGPYEQLTADAHLAALFTPDGSATLVDKPISGTVGSVRALALDDRRWGVLFDELHPDSIDAQNRAIGLWYAEHDGTRWVRVQAVPLPARGRVDVPASTDLVQVGDDLAWVAVTRLPSGASELVHYSRRDGQWTSEVISGDQVEVSALAYDARLGLWMVHFSEDSGIPGWQQSLRLYRFGPRGWEFVRRVTVVDRGVKVSDPSIGIFPGGVSVGWRVQSRDDMGAYAVVGIRGSGPGTPVALDPSVLQIMPLRPADGRPAWVVTHFDDPSGSGVELRVGRPRSGSRVDQLVAAPSIYRSGFLAAISTAPNEALVVGPEVSLEPERSYLRSLILRLRTSCT